MAELEDFELDEENIKNITTLLCAAGSFFLYSLFFTLLLHPNR